MPASRSLVKHVWRSSWHVIRRTPERSRTDLNTCFEPFV